MRTILQLAATLALTGAATAHAQITNPDKLIAPPPHNPASTADFQWLWQYTRPDPTGNKHDLAEDPRFTALLRDNLTAPQAFWGTGIPLSDAARIFLAGEGSVRSFNNRFIEIIGCVVDQCDQRGLLWIDLGAANPLIVFAALRWTESNKSPDQPGATFDLWLFPNRNLDPSRVPPSLQSSLGAWTLQPDANCESYKRFGTHLAAIVDTDGTPHVQPLQLLGVKAYDCHTITTNDPVITRHKKK
jgi:hypothetical protein